MPTLEYDRTDPITDLFDLFVHRYGLATVQAHLEMTAIESLYHAGLKGQYVSDLQNLGPLLYRLLALATEATPAPVSTVTAEHTPPSREITRREEEANLRAFLNKARPTATNGTPGREPLPLTVLDHCLQIIPFLSDRAWTCAMLRDQLHAWGIPPDGPYIDWAEQLAWMSQGQFPNKEVLST